MQQTDFSAAPARVCLGHQLPAVSFYLLHLASVICYTLSFYNTRERSTRSYGPFLAGGTNFGCQFWAEALEQNERRPQIVAAASKRGTRTHVRMICDDGHHASARTVMLHKSFPRLTAGLKGCAYTTDSV